MRRISDGFSLNDNVSEEDFKIIHCIGKGKFSLVYLVRKKDEKRYYAMKVMKKKWIIKNSMIDKVLMEQRILKLFGEHPFIIRLYYSFENEIELFLVMDYCPGGDLYSLIRKQKRFNEYQVKLYGAEIFLGIQYLHENSIIHRDLKLENIMMDEFGHLSLVDFGLSKTLSKLRKRAETQCGTPTYMSPEIVRNEKYTESTDWWSYGVLLYEMLTGYSPFQGRNWESLKAKILQQELTFPNNIPISLEAKDLITKLLARRNRNRLKGPDIIRHPFFAKTRMESVVKKIYIPSYRPRLKGPGDVSNFNVNRYEEIMKEELFFKKTNYDKYVETYKVDKYQDSFSGFEYNYKTDKKEMRSRSNASLRSLIKHRKLAISKIATARSQPSSPRGKVDPPEGNFITAEYFERISSKAISENTSNDVFEIQNIREEIMSEGVPAWKDKIMNEITDEKEEPKKEEKGKKKNKFFNFLKTTLSTIICKNDSNSICEKKKKEVTTIKEEEDDEPELLSSQTIKKLLNFHPEKISPASNAMKHSIKDFQAQIPVDSYRLVITPTKCAIFSKEISKFEKFSRTNVSFSVRCEFREKNTVRNAVAKSSLQSYDCENEKTILDHLSQFDVESKYFEKLYATKGKILFTEYLPYPIDLKEKSFPEKIKYIRKMVELVTLCHRNCVLHNGLTVQSFRLGKKDDVNTMKIIGFHYSKMFLSKNNSLIDIFTRKGIISKEGDNEDFKPPEKKFVSIEDAIPLSKKSDVYSLGRVYAYLLQNDIQEVDNSFGVTRNEEINYQFHVESVMKLMQKMVRQKIDSRASMKEVRKELKNIYDLLKIEDTVKWME